MIKLKRVCIPLGLDCNFRCKYCYRGLSKGKTPTEISPLMREYLQYIDGDWCQSVIISGGEPLLYFDKIKEVFSILKPSVHKKIMSNGSLLNEDIVKYLNDNRIELHFSHDGEATEYLRGQDVLKNKRIADLLRRVDILTVVAVCTNRNEDIMQNYRYTVESLGRENIFYIPFPVCFNGFNADLIDGFDYDCYERSFREYRHEVYRKVSYYSLEGKGKVQLLNVNLSGEIVEKNTLDVLGTVNDDREVIEAKLAELYKDMYCAKSECPFKEICTAPKGNASEHYCKCAQIQEGLC